MQYYHIWQEMGQTEVKKNLLTPGSKFCPGTPLRHHAVKRETYSDETDERNNFPDRFLPSSSFDVSFLTSSNGV